MPRGSSKSTAVIQRLLEERRQYESWIARLSSAANGTPQHVLSRVRADYEARLTAVLEELTAHGESARQALEQKQRAWGELQRKETLVTERLSETELRHAVGEYDQARWNETRAAIMAELKAVREELESMQADIEQLEELDQLARGRPAATSTPPPPTPPPSAVPPRRSSGPSPSFQPAPLPPPPPSAPMPGFKSGARLDQDELEFIKSVTEDEKGSAPSPRRASGEQFQPARLTETPQAPSPVRAATPVPPPVVPEPKESAGENQDAVKTLRCRQCGTMNLPTEWYCEQCGFELAAV